MDILTDRRKKHREQKNAESRDSPKSGGALDLKAILLRGCVQRCTPTHTKDEPPRSREEVSASHLIIPFRKNDTAND